MKALLLILALAIGVSAQTPEWKLIKELTGEFPDRPNAPQEFRVAEIARGDDLVKLMVRVDFPNGMFDHAEIRRIEFKAEFTLVLKPINKSAEIYLSNGKHVKSKEAPTMLDAGRTFVGYFCERGETPTKAPTLKP